MQVDYKGARRSVDSATQTDSNTSEAAVQTVPVLSSTDQTVHIITESSQPSQSISVTATTNCSISMVDDSQDISYQPSTESVTTSQSQSQSTTTVSLIDDRKFLVFESQLDRLFNMLICPKCQSPYCADDMIKKCIDGTQLHVIAFGVCGHVIVDWVSQPVLGRMPAGNLLLSAATVFSGQTYQHVQNIAQFLNLNFMSSVTFYEAQRTNLVPVILTAWKNYQQCLFDELRRAGKPLRLCGDGRMDSPGFSAKYCTYSLMDMTSNKVLSFAVVTVTEAGGSSTNMEVLAFERCLDELHQHGFTVEVIATDRHVQVRSLMKRKFPSIRHQFDVWHVAKSFRKKLHAISQKKINSDLSPWSQSISNHLWWCAANCGGDANKLTEMWISIIHHVVNVHHFSGEYFQHCAHPCLSDNEQRRKKWLEPLSPAHNALKEIVMKKTLLTDIRHLSEFCHTGQLEVYHSLITKYCPKRQEFDLTPMTARTALAVLDHNNNVDRQQQVTSDGVPRVKTVYSKVSRKWVVKPIYECKTYDYISDLLNSVVDQQETHSLEPVSTSSHCQNIAPIPAPSKSELLSRHCSRFS